MHRHPLQLARLQLGPQAQEGLGRALEGAFGHGNQQQGRLAMAPVALQQAQLSPHRIGELLRIIGEVEGALLQHGGQEGQPFVATAIEAGGGHRFHPYGGMAAEAQLRVRPHGRHPFAELPGTGDPQPVGLVGARTRRCHGQPRLGQGLGNGGVGRHQGHQHPLGPQGAGQAPAAGVQVFGQQQALQHQVPQPGEALGPEQGHIRVGDPQLAAGFAPFGRDRRFRHQVELGQQGHPLHIHG